MGAQLRVVRRRIRSVQSTKKITRAMELIASSRIVKAQQRVEAARPVRDPAHRRPWRTRGRKPARSSHPLLEEREQPAKAGVLVVTSDRGLAGSYNSNVLKIAEQQHRVDPRPRARARAVRERQEGRRATSGSGACRSAVSGRVTARCRRTRSRRRSATRLIEDFADRGDRRAALRVHRLPFGVHAARHRTSGSCRSRPRR